MLEQLRRNWCIFSHWSSGKVISIILLLFHNLIPKCQQNLGEYEKTNVWVINPSNDKVHPAVFPVELAARIVQFYSFKGDLVFDPFGGSGTVGEATMALDRYFFLCEQEVEYVEHAMKRLNPSLFSLTVLPRSLSLSGLKSELEGDNTKP